MREELRKRIIEANKIIENLKSKGYLVGWNEKNRRTEIYIPGGVYGVSRTVGYITKENKVVMF